MGVKVYGVQALTQADSIPFYQELAEASGGRYLRLRHFDVITDMFLAVCYRESNEQDLQAFVLEVQGAGRMTSERRELFQQLELPSCPRPSASSNQQRYVAADWWDPDLESRSEPAFHYDTEQDKWMTMAEYREETRNGPTTGCGEVLSFPKFHHSAIHSVIEPSPRRRSRRTRRLGSKRCEIM